MLVFAPDFRGVCYAFGCVLDFRVDYDKYGYMFVFSPVYRGDDCRCYTKIAGALVLQVCCSNFGDNFALVPESQVYYGRLDGKPVHEREPLDVCGMLCVARVPLDA